MANSFWTFQGRFTSDGTAHTIQLPAGFDWVRVYNETALAQTASDLGAEFYFQRGMTNGRGVVYTKLGTVANDPLSIGQIAANAGFTEVDTSGNPLGASIATTATNATQPVYTTANTGSLATGSVVRVFNQTGQANLSGFDFAVDTVVANTSFTMAAALATAPGAAATAGQYRHISFDPQFYPRFRYIVNISQAANAVVTVSVPSGYHVGQEVRVLVPQDTVAGTAIYGMTEIDGLLGTVTAVNDTVGTQTVTLDIDSSAFTAFTFPTAAQFATGHSRAMLVPVGEDTGYALAQSQDILSDATDNQGFRGVTLAAGTLSPAGQNNDVIYWVAGTSYSVDNQ